MVADLDDNTKAAIASPECATTYGLKILDDKLHHKNNSTRFIAISNKIFTSPNAKQDKPCVPPSALYRFVVQNAQANSASLDLKSDKARIQAHRGQGLRICFLPRLHRQCQVGKHNRTFVFTFKRSPSHFFSRQLL